MAEITKAIGLEGFIDTNYSIIEMGELKREDVLKWSIPYKGDPDYIDYIETSCSGCTKATLDKENKQINIEFTAIKGVGFDSVPIGKTAVTKVVTIQLDKTQNTFKGGPNLERVTNKDKPFIRITLNGYVMKE